MDILHANEQYRKLMMTKNRKPTYELRTVNSAGQWTFRMLSEDREYLEGRGKEWKRLELIEDFKISEKA